MAGSRIWLGSRSAAVLSALELFQCAFDLSIFAVAAAVSACSRCHLPQQTQPPPPLFFFDTSTFLSFDSLTPYTLRLTPFTSSVTRLQRVGPRRLQLGSAVRLQFRSHHGAFDALQRHASPLHLLFLSSGGDSLQCSLHVPAHRDHFRRRVVVERAVHVRHEISLGHHQFLEEFVTFAAHFFLWPLYQKSPTHTCRYNIVASYFFPQQWLQMNAVYCENKEHRDETQPPSSSSAEETFQAGHSAAAAPPTVKAYRRIRSFQRPLIWLVSSFQLLDLKLSTSLPPPAARSLLLTRSPQKLD